MAIDRLASVVEAEHGTEAAMVGTDLASQLGVAKKISALRRRYVDTATRVRQRERRVRNEGRNEDDYVAALRAPVLWC